MGKTKEERISEIDARIEDLKEHAKMWIKAGGMGNKMAMQAYGEIEELEIEKEDLINGTNKLQIHLLNKKLIQLKVLKEESAFVMKLKYINQIKKAEEELANLSR